MANTRVTPDERAAIITTLRETENVRETARRHNRGRNTVSRIAIEAGLDVAGRPQTKTATEAITLDNRAKLALLKSELIDDARGLRAELHQPCVERKAMTVSRGGDRGAELVEVEVHHPSPPFADKQRIMTSVGIAVDKVIALERLDPPDTSEGRSILEQLVDGLRTTS